MQLRNFGRQIWGVALIVVMLVGSGFVSGADAGQRRGRNWDGYPNLGGSFDLRQTALNAGYNEGSKEGRNDRDKQRFRDYRDIEAYQKASKDYSSKLGDRDLYQRYFRMAFESGYETENGNPSGRPRSGSNRRGRNWDRYGSYGGSFELRQTALNAGYNEGVKQGRNDGKKGRRRSYRDFSAYRNATEDYSSKLGSRDLYQRYYREGFENGYEDGLVGN